MEQTGPLVVLAAGQRCGSTLIQRLLCSHPSVQIWGEHVGQLRPLLAAAQRLHRWTESSGMAGRNEFSAHGHHGFIANLTPEGRHIDAACVAFVETLLATPAREAGRPIWGFKEIHYGLPDVLALRRLFPGMRVIQLVRDPRDVLSSLDDWERSGGWSRIENGAVRTSLARAWRAVSLRSDADPELRGFILPVRYEDLISYHPGWTDAIAEHCRLDAALLDESVFGNGCTPRARAAG